MSADFNIFTAFIKNATSCFSPELSTHKNTDENFLAKSIKGFNFFKGQPQVVRRQDRLPCDSLDPGPHPERMGSLYRDGEKGSNFDTRRRQDTSDKITYMKLTT